MSREPGRAPANQKGPVHLTVPPAGVGDILICSNQPCLPACPRSVHRAASLMLRLFSEQPNPRPLVQTNVVEIPRYLGWVKTDAIPDAVLT